MALSRRLQAITDFVRGKCVADIGCDHAYVAMACILQKKADYAYACDISPEALKHARENIRNNALEEYISVKLSDGIYGLSSEVDTLVIAGMGGLLIRDILQKDKRFLKEGMMCVFSPHKDVSLLREYLVSHGFSLQKERVVEEQGHFYPILVARYQNRNSLPLTCFEAYYGRNCLKDLDYRNYLNYEINKWDGIYRKLPDAKNTEAKQRLIVLNCLLDSRAYKRKLY